MKRDKHTSDIQLQPKQNPSRTSLHVQHKTYRKSTANSASQDKNAYIQKSQLIIQAKNIYYFEKHRHIVEEGAEKESCYLETIDKKQNKK